MFLNPEKPCLFSATDPHTPGLWHLGSFQHPSCELKIDGCSLSWGLYSMLSSEFALMCSSLFGSPKDMKFAVSCSLALWFVADLFSTKCAPNSLFYFGLVSEGFPWRLFRVSIKIEKLELKEFTDKSGPLPHFLD